MSDTLPPLQPSGMKDIVEKHTRVGDIFYRAYGGGSKKWGRSFFVPAIANNQNYQLSNYWTSELLEKELNAALWGNTFEFLLVARATNITPPLKYKIGTVVQGHYRGLIDGKTFTQRDFITPSGLFKEVQFDSYGIDDLKFCLEVVEHARPINAGNFARKKVPRDHKWC